ncbi:GlcG/HbpS family heme-binding protein [Alicyclobacillus acidoterrestris]|uniref:Heme-binding protein n=1 Tax=Alicyclobacillus acidoterrestris (strain ATCC 49025 / DSM 3922 / CIP 106132 / NCIMB 13137 / GD3B) TaxID=1356854 RepID=T0DSY3_ALIAG|nr:heme-binding protein [Alicyclobacillus acidoterrestris]EPZ52556.1 hypothetical protein N007_20410 [Alicyclobacillus acidoterrestris ATCC 49025]UNO47290.1 heme-binding protein [Alicyclobacillus acidoterrestris]
MRKLGLQTAKKLIDGAEQEARRIGVPMVITVVDDGGNLVAAHRMDDALLASVDISLNKAWTAVALKMSTAQLASEASTDGELYGIHATNHGRVVIFGGGIPLHQNGRIVGAVGVSGGSVNEDVQVAEAAVRVYEQLEASCGDGDSPKGEHA